MGRFDKRLGKKADKPTPPPAPDRSIESDPASDPNMIKVYDEYGRDLFITKEQWRDNVLLGNLEKHRDSPDDLYGMLVGALEDGFAADVVGHAEHLRRIDPIPSRGTTVLGIIYMEVNRLDDAQRVFDEYIAEHGEEGVVLTNLAKVCSRRGDDVRAEEILWHALELDPNQDNGLGWYAAIQRERNGEDAALAAFGRVAALPNSWRARLWLARNALQQNDLIVAEALYQEALASAGHPVPTDLLMQMSGDLGNSGYLDAIIRLAGPYFDPAFHGLQAGNNLIKANLELGRIEEARCVLKQLYAQKRPDWKPTLNFWDTELAGADIAKQPQPQADLKVSILSIEGPLWMRGGSPFAALLPVKRNDAKRIAILGSTVLQGELPEKPALQLSDGPGRLSRAIPLIMAELIQIASDAVGIALIPWAQGMGFALFGQPSEDAALGEISSKEEDALDYVIGVAIYATLPYWKIDLRLVRRVDGQRLAETSVEVNAENPGSVIDSLPKALSRLLTKQDGIIMTSPPKWFQLPTGYSGADYMLRIEQLLTITCENLDFLEGGNIYGEREMLDGSLLLCVNQPKNPTVRMLYAQMLRQMKKASPEIILEYMEKTEHLQRDYPLKKEIELLVEASINESFAS